MDTRTFAATLLKVAGLVTILHALSELPGYFPLSLNQPYPYTQSQAVAAAALNVLPPIVLGFFLWFFPGKVTNKIIVPEEGAEPIPLDSVERVALTTVGLFLVAWGLSNLAFQVGVYFEIRENQNHWIVLLPRVLWALTQVIVGAVFILGARTILRWIQSMRQRTL